MPPPPPPPPRLPAPPEMPPAEPFNFQSSKSSGGNDQGALLKDIRQGIKLKKTVTNDKSGPFIAGKPSGSSNNSNSSSNSSNQSNKVTSSNRSPQSTSTKPTPNGGFNCEDILSVNLRPTGLRTVKTNTNNNNNSNSNVDSGVNKKTPPEISNKPNFNRTNSSQQSKASQIQDALRKQMTARGPPPQPPVSQPSLPSPSKPVINEDKPINRFISNNKINSELNQINSNKNSDNTDSSAATVNLANILPNSSTLHRTNNILNTTIIHKPIASHGKPNVAPKPPGVKPSPPGRIVNRTQSMRVPRSPGAVSNNQPPFTLVVNGNDFNSLKNISTLHQSHEALNRKVSATTPIRNLNLSGSQQHIGRPTQPPPSRPPQNKPPPPPPLRLPTTTTIAPPQSPPPPPPPSSTGSSRAAPPPPVSRNAPPPPPIHNRIIAPGNIDPPTPPVRHSSMRNGTQHDTTAQKELDNRYIFHPVSDFPRPDVFHGVLKEYPGAMAANKQPAPLPPNIHLQLGDKLWTGADSSTC